MRLNKKILSLAFAAILSLSLFTVSAASTVDVSMDYDNSISVSGKIDSDNMTPANIIVRLKDSSGNIVYVDVSKTIADEEGKLSYAFEPALLSLRLPSDTYEVSISGRNLSVALTDTVDIHGPDRKLKVLEAMSTADTAAEVGAVISGTTEGKANSEILKFDTTIYNGLTERGFVDSYLAPKTYAEGVDATDGLTDEEIKQIYDGIEDFYSDYADAMVSPLFADANTADKVALWIDSYYAVSGFNSDAALTAIVDEVSAEADFTRRIASVETAMPLSDIKAHIYESALLTYVYTRTDSEVMKLVSDFPAYFAVGANYTTGLMPYEKAAAFDGVAGVSYNSCSDVTNAIDAAAAAIISARGSGTGGNSNVGTGTGTGSGGGGYSVSVSGGSSGSSGSTAVQPKPVQPAVFSDLDSAAWAKEAILSLYNKDIISGKPDGTFMPNANITRAEFIKIAVEAFGLEEFSDYGFADVQQGSWYAPYVSKAYAKGLIKGDENNNFCPDADITRQDMVTILYRALGVDSGADLEVTFTDKDAVADYAYPAVGYFNSHGIVNGLEDGSFAPTRNATRAEAAMVFYKLISKLL